MSRQAFTRWIAAWTPRVGRRNANKLNNVRDVDRGIDGKYLFFIGNIDFSQAPVFDTGTPQARGCCPSVRLHSTAPPSREPQRWAAVVVERVERVERVAG